MINSALNPCTHTLYPLNWLRCKGLVYLIAPPLFLAFFFASNSNAAQMHDELTKKNQSDEIELLRNKVGMHHRQQQYVDEAATYHQLLSKLPNDTEALRGRAFAVLLMGAPNLALQYATQHRAIFTDAEWLNFEQARAGRMVRWGSIEAKAGIGQQRFQATDKAIQKSNMVRALHAQQKLNQSSTGRYSEFDRLVALRDREQMQEVVNLYQSLKQEQIAIPAYVLAATADAYLYLRQPQVARDLYVLALDTSKTDADYPNREWQLNLFNAYIDANQFKQAIEWIDMLVATIPPVINKGLKGVELDNEWYEQARVNQVQSRLYSEQPKQAQALLKNTLKSAPYSIDTRLANGELLQLREQPRSAQVQYISVLVDDPSNNAAANGIAETAISLNDTKTAQLHLKTLLVHYPENLETQRINQLMIAQNAPTLVVNSGYAKSPTGAGNRGNQDWNIDTQLYSALFQDNWRVFSHSFNSKADFNDMKASRERIGIGADYRSPSYLLRLELNQDQTRFSDYGVGINASWLASDYWRFSIGIETNSNDIPLQATLNGINMHQLNLSINFTENESRSINSNLSYAHLSDNNNRTEVSANWQERWVSGPLYKLDTVFSVSSSKNTLNDAIYFNPIRDYSADVQMVNEWTFWRNYQKSFKNTLVLGAGKYWQTNFQPGVMQQVRYTHEWTIDSARQIEYGIAHEKHPFDGLVSKTNLAFLNLNWHF